MSLSLNAQSISGKVVDEKSQNISYAEVVMSLDKKTYSAITDEGGNFTITLPKNDSYKMEIFLNGNNVFENNITIDGNVSKNYTIKSNDAVKDIQEVTITQKKKLVERKVDRLVFNVENSVAATGGNALDALKTTPLVRVQDENVSIIGKGEVIVMIDDRIQRMSQDDLASLLKSIPSDNIKSIEVITTPPAKYDAEGDSGLINIKLKKAKVNSWNANIGGSYTQKTYAGGGMQGMFNYNHNKLSLQVSANTNSQRLLTNSDSNIFYPNELWSMNVKNKSKENNLGLGLGADYKISDKWTSGLKYLGSFTERTSSNSPLTTRSNYTTGAVNSYIASDVDGNNKPNMNSINWNNTIKLDSAGAKITTDFDYFNYKKRDYRFFAGNEWDSQRNIIPETFFSSTNTNVNRVENYSGKVDVELPLKWTSLSFGGKYNYTNTDNDLVVLDHQTGTTVLNTDQSNIFNYKEHNEALYVSASKKLGEKWETQAGLRMEATQTTGYSENMNQTNKNNYVKLFPTAYVTYNQNDKNSFSLNYSRRIRRPNFDYLNPFVIRTSPYYYYEGNPFLKPSIIDNLEFSYIRNQKFVSSVYYSQVSNFSQEFSILDKDTNITKSTPLNYANTYQIGISSYYNFNKWSWWNSFTGFNANYQNVKSKTDLIGSIDGYNAYIYSNNDFTLNKSKTAFFSVNYGLQLPGRYQVFHISTMNILDVSVKFLFLEKNLTLIITGQDLLNGQRPLISYKSNGVETNVRSYEDSRGFRISLSYKFGNNNIKSEQRNFGNEDERNRVN
ncbi:outer membrane beta-barrel family protein [Chryseobacterium ginsengisoli]|uniref:Outer membrane beta-barrel family protein n=2 Tax=Chryseobacterium ginsengisoli TaxID=363853 RepID=A0ABP9LWY5_9FLAO